MIRIARRHHISALPTRPQRLVVEGLFGNADDIAFDFPNNERPLIILTGPNGSGKSTVFSILSHLHVGALLDLAQIRFKRVVVLWENGAELYVSRTVLSAQRAALAFRVSPGESNVLIPDITLDFELEAPELVTTNPARSDESLDSSLSDDAEINAEYEESATIFESVESITFNSWDDIRADDDYTSLAALCRALRTHYISTNRLATERREEDEYEDTSSFGTHDRIIQQAEWLGVLVRTFRRATARRKGQRTVLDVLKTISGPRGSLEPRNSDGFRTTLHEIVRRCEAVEQVFSTGRLKNDIEDFLEFLIENQHVTDRHADVVSLMLDETDAELAYPEAIAASVSALLKTANENLIGKYLRLHRLEGLEAFHSSTHAKIPLNKLSSGEQHLIVLLLELLREALEPFSSEETGTRVLLVDEPEISLHISWQHAVRDELFRMADLGQRIIVATHSPDMVGDRWECEVPLPYPGLR
jgi:predicted ATP-binding protein involved in virulence